MKNTIKYYYNIDIIEINQSNNIYIIKTNNKTYNFVLINNDLTEKSIDNISSYTKYNILINNIIKNKLNNFISSYNNLNYILLEININQNKKTTLEEINYLSNNLIDSKNINMLNWASLWANKIDYLEKQINENGKKFPVLVDTFNFFTGLSENAISYYNNIESYNYKPVISHKILTNKIDCLYNPLNIIPDHKSRDIAEYIKLSFFTQNKYIFKELAIYFNNNYYTKKDMEILFSRILYPSFYFKIYDEIILGIKKEKELSFLITQIPYYLKYLKDIFIFLNKYHQLEEVSWINQH